MLKNSGSALKLTDFYGDLSQLREHVASTFLPDNVRPVQDNSTISNGYLLGLYGPSITAQDVIERALQILRQAYGSDRNPNTDDIENFKVTTRQILDLFGAGVIPISLLVGDSFRPQHVHETLHAVYGAANGQGGTIIYTHLVHLVDWLFGARNFWEKNDIEKLAQLWLHIYNLSQHVFDG